MSEEMSALEQLGLQIELLDGWTKTARLLYVQALRDAPPIPPDRPDPLAFWWPVGTLAERKAGPGLPGDWFDAVPFGTLYQAGANKALHPACDLNRPAFADAGAEVYAPAIGEVTFAGTVENWQGWMVIVRHVLSNKQPVWSQMAHLDRHFTVHVGQTVERGTLIGHIGEYLPLGKANDHLHLAFRKKDLPASDWLGLNRDRVFSDYYSPVAFMAAHWGK